VPAPTIDALRQYSDTQIEVLRRQVRYYENADGEWVPGAAFYNFCKVILGLTEMEWETHGKLCADFETAYYGRMDPKYIVGGLFTQMNLLPRGGFKTTVITVGGTIWVTLQNDPPDPTRPNEGGWEPPRSFNGKKGYDQRMLLVGETDDKAREFGQVIRNHYERNGLIIQLFGKLTPNRYSNARWSTKQMDLSSRQDRVAREANINITSIDAAKVGGHYDMACLDDIVTDRQITSEDMIAKGVRLYEGLQPIMDPPLSIIWINGTRWHDADVYGKLIDDGHVKVLLERAERTKDEIAAGKGPLWFPSRLTQSYLDGKKLTMTPWLYSSQYNNSVIDQSDAVFKKEYFGPETVFDLDEGFESDLHKWEWLRSLTRVTTIDPAISKKKQACNAVVLTCGWDAHGVCWLLDMFREKGVKPRDLLNEIFRQNRVWSPSSVGMESHGFQAIYSYNAMEMAADLNEYPPFVELPAKLRDKDTRILGFEPICRQSRFRWQKKHKAIIDEFKRFPRGTYRDGIDALAYQLDLGFRGDALPNGDIPKSPVVVEQEAYEKKVASLEMMAYTDYRETDWYHS
jgi:hypothetical protein